MDSTPFLRLPTKVLHHIVSYLCPILSTSPLDGSSDSIEEAIQRHAIQNLSLTCTTLQKLLEPYIFTVLQDFDERFYARAQLDPNVFNAVKSLTLRCIAHPPDEYRRAHFLRQYPIVEREAAKYGINIQLNPGFKSDINTAKLGAALVAITPNVQRLLFTVDCWEEKTDNSPLLKMFEALTPSSGLSNLRSLEIWCGDSRGLKCSNDAQAILIGAAPHLQKLCLHSQNFNDAVEYEIAMGAEKGFNSVEHAASYLDRIRPGLANLRVLELRNCIMTNQDLYTNHLSNLVSLCPKLERFVYEADDGFSFRPYGRQEISPRQVLDAIWPVKSTLKRLAIVPSTSFKVDSESFVKQSQLLKFTQLRILMLDEKCFCKRYLGPQAQGRHWDLGLVEVLPPTAESILVTDVEDKNLAAQDLEALREQIEKFPALKEAGYAGQKVGSDEYWLCGQDLLAKGEEESTE